MDTSSEDGEEKRDTLPSLLKLTWINSTFRTSSSELPLTVLSSSDSRDAPFGVDSHHQELKRLLAPSFNREWKQKEALMTTSIAQPDIFGELAALQVKCSQLQSELKEHQSLTSLREAKVRELQSEASRSREDNARQSARVQILQQRLLVGEEEAATLRRAYKQQETTIDATQRENDELRARLDDLETRLRRHLVAREEAEQKSNLAERKLSETLSSLHGILTSNRSEGGPVDSETITKRVTELLHDNAHLQAKLVTVGGALASRESDAQTSERALAQLLAELQREQREVQKWKEKLTKESREREILEEQLRVMRSEVEELRAQNSALQFSERAEQLASEELRHLRESVARLLSSPSVVVMATNDSIKERIQTMMTSLDQRQEEVDNLRSQLLDVKQENSHDREELHHLEKELSITRERLAIAEADIRSSRREKEQLRTQKNECEDVIRRIYQSLWTDDRPPWTQVSDIADTIMDRVEEVMREGDPHQVSTLRRKERTLLAESRQLRHLCEILERERDEALEQVQILNMDVDRLSRKLQHVLAQKEIKLEYDMPKLRRRIIDGPQTKRTTHTPNLLHPRRPATASLHKGMPENRIREQKELRDHLVRMLGLHVGTEPATDSDILYRLEKIMKTYREELATKTLAQDVPVQIPDESKTVRVVHKH